MQASREIEAYFLGIEEELKRCYKIGNDARKKGYDPEEKVDIILTKNMAERVEGLISAVAPQIIGSGFSKRIQQLEKKYGALAWEVALMIAQEVAEEKFCKFKSKKEAMEAGIRAGFAYHTVGVVAAPLEGFIELKIKKRKDGREYFAPCFAGPVRGAGGTAAAFCLLLADFVRKNAGYAEYDPSAEEISRYATELYDYHERVTNLQYKPSVEEIAFLSRKMPVEIDGDPTEKIDVSNYKDLPRVETNRIRGGVCLVLSMLALKAPKLWKTIQNLKDIDLKDWYFLGEFLDLQKKMKSHEETAHEKTRLAPDYTFISDLVAGRPVITYPLANGGLRLRYGRTRASGFSSAALNPLTMKILNRYIATGTQLKLERPGKAAAITPCESIEGPVVRLDSGDVMLIDSPAKARQCAGQVKEILYLGDILISYGDFFDRAHPLVPPGYCEEWYVQEIEEAAVNALGTLDSEKLSDLLQMPAEEISSLLKNVFNTPPSAEKALLISRKLNVPLHPRYTYHWNTLSAAQFIDFLGWFEKAKIDRENKRIVLPLSNEKRALELVGCPHTVSGGEYVVVEKDHAAVLLELFTPQSVIKMRLQKGTPLEILNACCAITQRDKSGTFIGARMGRPEKAKMRKMAGSPHVLFPVGEEGGRLRCFQSALEAGKIKAEFPIYKCAACNRQTVFGVCEECSKKTQQLYYCNLCGVIEKPCRHEFQKFKIQELDIKHHFNAVLKRLKTKIYPDLIKGVRGTSNKNHIPEHLIKGFFRAAHNVCVNKDGTTRYDMTELPITHFTPKEVRTPVGKLKELGYEKDIEGSALEKEDQILELRPQDVILPSETECDDEGADEVLFRVAGFVDDLLVSLYGQKIFYGLKDKQGLVGQLVIGLAPHISAGVVGRIIGFSKTQALFAHPLYHAAMRRDADGDEACVMLLMDALLNFSRQYLPDSRGSRTMDAPLVLTARVVPAEVDDMVHKLDVAWGYPLEFYRAALEYKNPWDVKIEQLGESLNTPKQYEKTGFTHPVRSINAGVLCSAYKILPSMEEKLKGQMDIAEKLRAVNAAGVAGLVIEKHFIRDIKGNLRKFSLQQFRCVKCNKKFRRPPLMGVCDECSGKIIFTISEGSIIKYLEPALSLAEKYKVNPYLRQSLELTKQRVEEVFGKKKDTQPGLGRWFG